MDRMSRMRARLRGQGPRTTVARSARLLNRSARACPSQGTEKKRLGARSARACPSHAFRLKQDGQDGQDGQDEGVIAGAR